jgi:hypothetical protein
VEAVVAQPGGRYLTMVTLGISIVALILAGWAVLRPQPTVQAGPASVATPTTSSATTSPTSTDTGTGSPTETSSTDTNSDDSSGSATPALPTVGYTVSYQDKKLRLTPNNGCSYRQVDLDGPSVTSQTTISDVQFTPCGGGNNKSAQFNFPSESVATIGSTAASAQDCANAITTSPASQRMTLSRQLVICTVTDGTSTPDQPARQRIARIVIDNIGQDGTTDVTVTAWEIPH